jgi:hemerythrin superfamily protein
VKAEWRTHPNAPGPASMLLAIHDQFRAVSTRLVQLVDAGQPAVTLARVFVPLAQTLHHHHHAEEAMVFPFVHERTGIETEQLVIDHAQMTEAIAMVEASFRSGAGIQAAVARFHEILIAHLDREEELVIPIFLELDPHEAWARIHGA